MAGIQVDHDRTCRPRSLLPHSVIKVLLVRPALQVVDVPPPRLRVPRPDALLADWAEPVGIEDGLWGVPVDAQDLAVELERVHQGGKEVGEAAFVGACLNNERRLHGVYHVLEVHQVLGVLQNLSTKPSAVAVHRVPFEEAVILIDGCSLIRQEQILQRMRHKRLAVAVLPNERPAWADPLLRRGGTDAGSDAEAREEAGPR
mmetsp:Transcript_114874/g.336022  ORF Transcript_114874/g.336022 Transcript_114874/m.336022 type:complete len:202 (+) Transcript_114874:402-1007(+)